MTVEPANASTIALIRSASRIRSGLISTACRLDPGKIEQLLDEPGEPGALLVEGLLQLLRDLGREVAGPAAQRRRRAVDGGGRRPQLMRRERDEAVPGLVEPAQLLVEDRALHPERGPLRRSLEELDVLRAEAARLERTDVDHADDAVTRDQRGAEERLDPLLAQERVQHVGVVDVLDRHRPPLLGDPACEAQAEWDPHPALDLLLEPFGGPGHELAGGLVEHEERGRVRLQDVADSGQELVEQRVERQVRERRVRDEEELLQPLVRRVLRLVKTAVVDRKRRSVGGPLEELDLLGREDAWAQRADVHDTEYAPARDQRGAEERLDPFLAQERIQYVGVVDVLDRQRPALVGDSACEAPAERDPHPTP